jgi:outer membrane protein
MKKSIVFIIVLFWASVASAQDMRIAHVDSKLIFERYSRTHQAQKDYDRQVARWEQEANVLQQEVSALRERLEKQSLMLSLEKKKEMEAELSSKEKELQEFIQRIYGREGELLKENEKASAPLIQEIRKTIREVADQEGYDMVLDRATGAVLHWSNENDLTDRVLEYLNNR